MIIIDSMPTSSVRDDPQGDNRERERKQAQVKLAHRHRLQQALQERGVHEVLSTRGTRALSEALQHVMPPFDDTVVAQAQLPPALEELHDDVELVGLPQPADDVRPDAVERDIRSAPSVQAAEPDPLADPADPPDNAPSEFERGLLDPMLPDEDDGLVHPLHTLGEAADAQTPDLPDEVMQSLDRLHQLAAALAERRSTPAGADETPGRTLDDRVEGTLSFLEGYCLDSQGDTSAVDATAFANLQAVLGKARTQLDVLRRSRAPEDTRTDPAGAESSAETGAEAAEEAASRKLPTSLALPALAVDTSLGAAAAASSAWHNANAHRTPMQQRETATDASIARPGRASSALQAQARLDERQSQQTLPQVTLRSV